MIRNIVVVLRDILLGFDILVGSFFFLFTTIHRFFKIVELRFCCATA